MALLWWQFIVSSTNSVHKYIGFTWIHVVWHSLGGAPFTTSAVFFVLQINWSLKLILGKLEGLKVNPASVKALYAVFVSFGSKLLLLILCKWYMRTFMFGVLNLLTSQSPVLDTFWSFMMLLILTLKSRRKKSKKLKALSSQIWLRYLADKKYSRVYYCFLHVVSIMFL